MAEYPVQDLEGVPMSDVMQITLLQVEVARLEGGLAEAVGRANEAEDLLRQRDEEVDDLRAAIAAKEAALRAALNILKEAGLHDGPDSDDWLAAALPDTGEGKQPWHRGAAGRRWLPQAQEEGE